MAAGAKQMSEKIENMQGESAT